MAKAPAMKKKPLRDYIADALWVWGLNDYGRKATLWEALQKPEVLASITKAVEAFQEQETKQ